MHTHLQDPRPAQKERCLNRRRRRQWKLFTNMDFRKHSSFIPNPSDQPHGFRSPCSQSAFLRTFSLPARDLSYSPFPFLLHRSHWEENESQGKSAKGSSAWGTFPDASSAQRSVTPQWTMPSSFPLISEAHGAV